MKGFLVQFEEEAPYFVMAAGPKAAARRIGNRAIAYRQRWGGVVKVTGLRPNHQLSNMNRAVEYRVITDRVVERVEKV